MDFKIILMLSPLILIELVMKIVALVHLSKNPNPKGPKLAWALAIILITPFVWGIYFLFGRNEQ